MTKTYNKLIRDNIPEIIKNAGKTCVTEEMSDDLYDKKLCEKFFEEMQEFLQEFNAQDDEKAIAELADITEVVLAIVDFIGVDRKSFEKIRKTKADKNGAFEKRLLLKEVIENE